MKRYQKRLIWFVVVLFTIANTISAFHAYKFTHFSDNNMPKTKDARELTWGQKLKTFFFGINNPRPENDKIPQKPYQTISLNSNKRIECWSINHQDSNNTDSNKGTVIIFHGFSGCKSTMLDKADEFFNLGYNILMADFMGSGGSEGLQTTIGYKEAEEVHTCFEYVTARGEKNIILFGTSMGAVAIVKAIHDYQISPKGIIIECPFGTLYKTTSSRFQQLGVPSFPLAGLLDFWGGVENGFNPFSFSTIDFAKSVKCPTLLLYGERDEKVSKKEINDIFSNLGGTKQLKTYPKAMHENYLRNYKKEWVTDVSEFLNRI